MEIEMICPVCGEKVEIKDIPEIEHDYDEDAGEHYGLTTVNFYCPECEKSFYIGG